MRREEFFTRDEGRQEGDGDFLMVETGEKAAREEERAREGRRESAVGVKSARKAGRRADDGIRKSGRKAGNPEKSGKKLACIEAGCGFVCAHEKELHLHMTIHTISPSLAPTLPPSHPSPRPPKRVAPAEGQAEVRTAETKNLRLEVKSRDAGAAVASVVADARPALTPQRMRRSRSTKLRRSSTLAQAPPVTATLEVSSSDARAALGIHAPAAAPPERDAIKLRGSFTAEVFTRIYDAVLAVTGGGEQFTVRDLVDRLREGDHRTELGHIDLALRDLMAMLKIAPQESSPLPEDLTSQPDLVFLAKVLAW